MVSEISKGVCMIRIKVDAELNLRECFFVFYEYSYLLVIHNELCSALFLVFFLNIILVIRLFWANTTQTGLS